jgi:uncharacterized Fe-S center protein
MKTNTVADVYFIPVDQDERPSVVARKMTALFRAAGLGACIDKRDRVAIKMHFGEKGNDTHISPGLVRPVVEEIRNRQGQPFLTDTCVLYRSRRDNAVDHLRLAHEHGFRVDRVGAPVIIGDGLLGNAEKTVDIRGKIFKQVSIASVALEANAIIVMSHVTGHMATGMGGAIKNVGMGFASRKGKLRQHSVMKPEISAKKCTGCQECIRWCPADAIAMAGEAARIDSKICIGCGECLTVCRFDAVRYDWRVENAELQRRMAEHALGVVSGRQGKIAYINVLIGMTKDCDCMSGPQERLIPDMGILAGLDPVAVDAASLDLVRKREGEDIAGLSYPGLDSRVQIRHGEEVGLGSSEYRLVEVEF